jgi:hypothetical protein
MLARSGAVSVITDVLQWICRTFYRYVSRGKVPAICHLHYDPFSALPEPLLDLSPVENDLIALRLPFMKLRVLAPSIRGGSKRFGQPCLRGMVINVPTDLTHIYTKLPQELTIQFW